MTAYPANTDQRNKEPPQTRDLPDGYYLISSPKEPQACLVYLYGCEDFDGTRHIAWQIPDGGGLIPVTELTAESILTPVAIIVAGVAMTNHDLSVALKATAPTITVPPIAKDALICKWHNTVQDDDLLGR